MRTTRYEIDERLRRRYSPIEFSSVDIKEEDLLAIFEAGITAPSSFNEQPWRFVIGSADKFHSILTEKNLLWASKVEVFVLLCAQVAFSGHPNPDGSPKLNNKAVFDTGTCFGMMQIEGMNRGIRMHPMGGFSIKKAREIFPLEGLDPICVIAFGKAQEAVEYTSRHPIESFVIRG